MSHHTTDDGMTLSLFWEGWELFADAALSGTVAGAMLGFLGVYVVSRRMVFLSAALSQTAGLGVTLAFYAKLHLGLTGILVSPSLGATVLTFLAVLLLMSNRKQAQNQRDSLLGLVFLVGSAGTLMIGARVAAELHDIKTLLFGTAVAVLPEDFHTLLITAILIGALHLWWARGFAAVTLDIDGARVRGLPTRILELLLLLTLAVAVSLTTRVLGALPAFAFSILPAMAALRLAPNIYHAMILAALLGAGIGFGGYLVSFLYSFPVGSSQTTVAVGIVVLVELGHQAWQRLRPKASAATSH